MNDIKGFEGLYAITEDGKVWSYRASRWLALRGSGKSTRFHHSRNYKTITLSKDGPHYFYVHRLVAYAFVANPENLPCVNHLNGDGSDNRVENLEWCTRAQNAAHTAATGRSTRGEKDAMAKLKAAQVMEIRERYAAGEVSQSALGKEFGVTQGAIQLITSRQNWRHI